MAKQTGLGMNCYVSGYDLSGDVGSIKSISGGNKPLEVTGIDKSAPERLGGLRDGAVNFSSWFNPSAGQAHPVLSALPTADVLATVTAATALGSAAVSLTGKQINYDGDRKDDGSLAFDVNALANGFGLEWGVLLTAGKRTDTGATNGTAVDLTTVSTEFGWQAYLHVFAFTGTSVTVTLEDSANNTDFLPLTGGAFTAATGVTSERLQGGRTATVRRYVRAVTSGVFNPATFAVMFVRNEVAVAF